MTFVATKLSPCALLPRGPGVSQGTLAERRGWRSGTQGPPPEPGLSLRHPIEGQASCAIRAWSIPLPHRPTSALSEPWFGGGGCLVELWRLSFAERSSASQVIDLSALSGHNRDSGSPSSFIYSGCSPFSSAVTASSPSRTWPC